MIDIKKTFSTIIKDQINLGRILFTNPKFWCVLVIDVLLIVLSLYLSYLIRFEFSPKAFKTSQVNHLLTMMIPVKLFCFYLFGLYRGMWRYTSISDVLNVWKGSLLAASIVIVELLYLNRFEGVSRSVFVLDTVFTVLLITIHRIAIRFYYINAMGPRSFIPSSMQQKNLKRVLMVGAGDAGEKTIREIRDNKQLPFQIIAIVDDDPGKTGMRIHGVPVVGQTDDLIEHARRTRADELLIAISAISGSDMKRIVTHCQASSLPFKVLPGLGELIDGKVSVSEIREIDYRDLLGRKEIQLDQDQIGNYLAGRTIFVTGAGGSIGSELCRQIIRFDPAKILLFDASEENLYNIQMELLHEKNFAGIIPILGKVQDLLLLKSIFSQYVPSVVFHAAAFKHVPLIENHPWQAVENNIVGSQLLMEAAIVYGVERFVLVSTDKAVRPTNVMGASKRMTELLMHAYSSSKWDGFLSTSWDDKNIEKKLHNTIFMAVRFGNVIGSSGSVLPLFKKQIIKGGPVTVTHPEITRYFMSIEEAAQLIIQAGSMGSGFGEIFILDMGEPVKISDMANDLIKLAGKKPGIDIEIVFTGLRDGEKLYEELITEGEGIVETQHDKIMVLRDNNSKACRKLQFNLEKLQHSASKFDEKAIRNILKDCVFDYSPSSIKN